MGEKNPNIRVAGLTLLGSAMWIIILVIVLTPDASHKLEEALNPTPAPRFVYFKLPIEQTKYHWVSKERAAFLAGTLTLHIHGAGDYSGYGMDGGARRAR